MAIEINGKRASALTDEQDRINMEFAIDREVVKEDREMIMELAQSVVIPHATGTFVSRFDSFGDWEKLLQ